jgi:hypothetical protein
VYLVCKYFVLSQLYADWTEEHPLWASEEVHVEWPVAGRERGGGGGMGKRGGGGMCVFVRARAINQTSQSTKPEASLNLQSPHLNL